MFSSKIHFYLNLLVDYLQEVSKLSIKFQYDMVDITTFSATIDIIISILSRPEMGLCLVVQAKIWEFF